MSQAKYRRGDFTPFFPAQEGLIWGDSGSTLLTADDCTRAVRWLTMFGGPPSHAAKPNSRDVTTAANAWFTRNGLDLTVSQGAIIKAAFDLGYTIKVQRGAQDCTLCLTISEDFPK